MSAEARLIELGIELPEPAVPAGSYVTSVQSGNMLYLAGHLPAASEGSWSGKVGSDLDADEAAVVARAVGINLLATIRATLGNLDRVVRIVKVLGFVNSAPGFSDQPKVINGCSDLMAQVFGERGRHARSAVGANELPLNTPVEIEMIVQFD
ncbi:MAG: RidA family protein [Chloroflexi bacterium]|nr:RidA family protein [Chloroflexota bacterium]